MKRTWLLIVLALVAVAAYRSVLMVDETEYVIVTQFGQPVATLREPGLHLKWPYQSAVGIDRRLQIYNPPPSECLTLSQQSVTADVFVCWRVDDPQRFLETVGDLAGAELRLHDLVRSELAAELGRRTLDALLSADAPADRLDTLAAAVTQRCAERARAGYGIAVVDVRMKQIALPARVRQSVLDRMRTEQERIAERYRAEGDQEAASIRAAADKDRAVLLAQAEAEARKIRGEGEAEAARIYAEAYRKDPQFYQLFRTLEAYRKCLDEKTTIVLSGDSELFRYLHDDTLPAAQPPAAKPPEDKPAEK